MESDIEDSEAFYEQISPKTLERVCQVAESLNETDEDEPPLSPIVGYSISSSEENANTESSSDPENDKLLAEMNAKLAAMVGKEILTPEPCTPRSQLRKRLRKRRYKTMKQRMLFPNETKRQKMMENSDDAQTSETNLHDSKLQKPCTSKYIPEAESKAESFVGFQTASGKPVSISEKALQKAKSLFRDIDAKICLEPELGKENCDMLIKPIHSTNFDNAQTSETNLHDSKLQKPCTSKYIPEAESKAESFVGFQTASGKPVSISEKALQKAKSLFRDIDAKICLEPEHGKENCDMLIEPIHSKSSDGAGKTKYESMTQEQDILDCIQAFLNDEQSSFD